VEKSGRRNYIMGMEEAPEIGKESSHSVHANGMNEMKMTLSKSSIFRNITTKIVFNFMHGHKLPPTNFLSGY
jgi:hypothetical protein